MDDIIFGCLCEVDHIEELEDGIHHRVWIHTLCPRKTTMVFTWRRISSDFKPGFRFWLDIEDGSKER